MSGYKTYVCTFVGALVVLGMGLGYIDSNIGGMLLGLLGFGSVAALRSGIDKTVRKE